MKMTEGLAHLPKEPADRLTAPFLRFVRVETMAGAARATGAAGAAASDPGFKCRASN